MSRLSLRLRSVVAATLAILLAVVIVGAGVDLLVSRHLHRSLNRDYFDTIGCQRCALSLAGDVKT